MLKRLANNEDSGSMAARMRRQRFALFTQLLSRLPGRIRVLDIGGTPVFWRVMGFADERVELTLLNQQKPNGENGSARIVVGDARHMCDFRDLEFDVAFSNSVIEHVGTFEDQRRMASEIRRVAKRYFVQTPNKYFPIEPHFLIPGFQFFPLRVRATLLARHDVGWYRKADSYAAALEEVSAVRLLSKRDIRRLFPEGHLYTERFFGLSKSFVVYHGWDSDRQSDRTSR